MKRVYALSVLFTILLTLAGCSARLTTEKAQGELNKWITDYPGSVEVQGIEFVDVPRTYVKLKFSDFVYRDEFKGDLKYFSGDGTALFVKKDADWILNTVWVDKQPIYAENPNVASTNDASDSNSKAAEKAVNDDLKVLAQGAYSSAGSPFFVIVRDASTYAALREQVSNLPEVGADYFRSNTIFAAFRGECKTGGYSVRITRVGRSKLKAADDVLSIREIVSQGLTHPTQPYQVVSVQLGEDESIDIDNRMNNGIVPVFGFEVTSGEFETDIDAPGQKEKFQFGGFINLDRWGKFVTLSYYFTESGGQERKLSGKATGILQPDGRFIIAPISAGTFIKQPHSPLRVSGKFPIQLGTTALKFPGVSDLILSLESLPTKVSSSFSGKGKLEAKEKEPM